MNPSFRWRTTTSFAILALGTVLCSVASAQVRSVTSVVMKVRDMDRAASFYTKVLSFEKISDVVSGVPAVGALEGVPGARVRTVQVKLGAETVELMEFVESPGDSIPADARSNDSTFQHIAIVVSDMEKAYALLREHRVTHVSAWPQTLPEWNRNAAGIRAFYFRDPDNHTLEIIFFPPGKGDPRWQKSARGRSLFLGVDHTAIVVKDTERSLAFYRDILGFRLAGSSENYGIEQEHLNGVFGAHLLITGLRSPSGPGIEFLEYLAPADGRGKPTSVKPNDLVDTETVLRVPDSKKLAARIRTAHLPVISSAPADIEELRATRAILVRDPDGHTVRLTE